jgi:hypothetical protein
LTGVPAWTILVERLAARALGEMEIRVGETAALEDVSAGTSQQAAGTCVGCGRPLATVLVQLGSLRCHDCRDDAGRERR